MKTIRICLVAAVAGAAAVGAAACGSSGGGGGSGERDTYTFGMPDPFDAAPEPTPLGPVYLSELSTSDGTPRITAGKCLGFTLVANEEGLYFGPETKVTVGPLGVQQTLLLDGGHLRVGASANAYRCTWTPLFGAPGTWDVTVEQEGFSYTIEDAITVEPTRILEVGLIDDERVWSLDRVSDDGANVFEVPYDVDVYRANFYAGTASHVFAHMEFFPSGVTALLPIMEFRELDHPEILTARGGLGLIFPLRGLNYVVVRDHLGQGGPGATYDVSFVTQVSTGAGNNETCFDAPLLSTRTYYANYDVLGNEFDPDGSSGCRDSVYGNPIRAPGNDAVWRVKVPPGKELRVSTYDDHIDNVTLLLPVSVLGVGTNGCPARPTNCAAASGRFGGGNTDTLVYENVSGVEEEFFLIHDSATVMTSGVGSFLFDVELFDRY